MAGDSENGKDGAAITIDPQNPLPDPSFMWRRIVTLLVSFACLLLSWHNAEALHEMGDIDAMLTFSKWIIAVLAGVLLAYFTGPSVAEVIQLIQSAKIIRSSISVASEPAQNRPGAGTGGPIRPSPAPESLIPEAPLSGPENRPTGDSDISGEIDAAPRGRD